MSDIIKGQQKSPSAMPNFNNLNNTLDMTAITTNKQTTKWPDESSHYQDLSAEFLNKSSISHEFGAMLTRSQQ